MVVPLERSKRTLRPCWTAERADDHRAPAGETTPEDED
jgi:hypothetical protein